VSIGAVLYIKTRDVPRIHPTPGSALTWSLDIYLNIETSIIPILSSLPGYQLLPHIQPHPMAPSRGSSSLSKAYSLSLRRAFTSATTPQSGHSRWSKIKHDKGKADAQISRARSIFAQEIAQASKLFGPEPIHNPRLADLITRAKKEGFAKASIENAIARGQGKSSTGAALESLTVEGVMPGGVGVIVECETDNKLRTLAAVRLAIKEGGGMAGNCSYLFEKKGRIVFAAKEGLGSVDALDAALEAGATDVDELPAGEVVVFAEPGSTQAVGEAVAKELGLEVKVSEIIWDPNEDTQVPLASEDAAADLGTFLEDIQEKETSVRAIAMNIAQGSLSAETWKDLQDSMP